MNFEELEAFASKAKEDNDLSFLSVSCNVNCMDGKLYRGYNVYCSKKFKSRECNGEGHGESMEEALKNALENCEKRIIRAERIEALNKEASEIGAYVTDYCPFHER